MNNLFIILKMYFCILYVHITNYPISLARLHEYRFYLGWVHQFCRLYVSIFENLVFHEKTNQFYSWVRALAPLARCNRRCTTYVVKYQVWSKYRLCSTLLQL